MPRLDTANRLARHGLRQVCIVILLIMIVAHKGNDISCQRKAALPIAITSGSLRKIAMICGVKANPANAQTIKKIVPIRSVNQNAF